MGDYDRALKVLDEELDIAKQGQDEPHVAFAEAEIGTVLLEQEKYPLALQQYDQSYTVNKGLGRLLSQAYNQHNRGKLLAQLGRFEEARLALDEASSIATEKGYKQLIADIQVTHAQIFLAERRFAEAKVAATTAIERAGSRYKEVTVEAKLILGLAQSLSGARAPGKNSCAEAFTLAQGLGDSGLLSRTMLALAETTIETGDAEAALQIAKEVRERFARAGQTESEWRALLILSRSHEIKGDKSEADAQRSAASQVLSRLEQDWGSDAYRKYLTRPDIQYYYRQVGR